MPYPNPRIENALNAAVILAAVATIPLVVLQERGASGAFTTTADWCVWVVFLVEYVVMISLVADKKRYARENWLSLAVIILSFPRLPTLLSLIRVVRVVRIVRLFRILAVTGRALPALQAIFGRRGVKYVASLAIFMVLVGGGMFDVFEDGSEGFWDGVWCAVVTTTTVGLWRHRPRNARRSTPGRRNDADGHRSGGHSRGLHRGVFH